MKAESKWPEADDRDRGRAGVKAFWQPPEFDHARYRFVEVIGWVWLGVFVIMIAVPLALNGWDRRALADSSNWRTAFGVFLIASGFSGLVYCRTHAAYLQTWKQRSQLRRLMGRLFRQSEQEPAPYPIQLVIAVILALLTIGLGIGFCANLLPHPGSA
jgi:hypothetical protein